MKPKLVHILKCLHCLGELEVSVFEMEREEIKAGVLICKNCESFYFIDNFIPRMLPKELYYNADFLEKYKKQINSLGIQPARENKEDKLKELKQQTIEKFGFEWLKYSKFGWDEERYSIEREERIFKYKSLLEEHELRGKIVLDAGCGNGRYSFWAAKYGAEVFGVDLGMGVEAAYENTKHLPNVHIIQGDIFNLPFKKDFFDIIFSIGVLMHTGNAKLATRKLVSHLKKGGTLTVHLYHKGNFIYEINDALIRKITTRLPLKTLCVFTEVMFAIAEYLKKARLLKYVNMFIRLEAGHPHFIFDWYSAPIATHHTYPEVYQWFKEFSLEVVKDNNKDSRNPIKRWINPPWSLTVKGVKK